MLTNADKDYTRVWAEGMNPSTDYTQTLQNNYCPPTKYYTVYISSGLVMQVNATCLFFFLMKLGTC